MTDPASPASADSTATVPEPAFLTPEPSIPTSGPAGPGMRSLRLLVIGPGLADASSEALGTVRALVESGHRVVCLQDPQVREDVARGVAEGAGARFLPIGPPARGAGLRPGDPTLQAARRVFAAALRAGDHDALVYEDRCFYGKTLADAMGIPAIRLCTGFAPSRAIMADMAAVSTRRGARGIYRDGASARLMSWSAHRMGLIEAGDVVAETLENRPAASFVYTTASFQMRPETLAKGHFHFVGPSVAQRADLEEDQGLISFDGMRHPIVHVSLGPLTAGQGSRERHRLRRTARLYRTCIEAFADQRAGVLISIGHGGDPSLLGPLPANVHVHQDAPRLTVLRHADLFITDGAMGPANEAMYYGVPTIIIPSTGEQPAVAARVTELGLGSMIPSWELSPQIVRHQAATLLDDVGVRLLLNRMSRDMQSTRGSARAAREIASVVRRVRAGRDGAVRRGRSSWPEPVS